MVEEKVLKGRIARVIAATRFPFVGQDDWDESRTTVVNDYRNKEWAFDTPDGPLYPSVAVLNARSNPSSPRRTSLSGGPCQR